MVTVIRRESATEYFKEMVAEALERQHLAAADPTRFYLVKMLAAFASGDARAGDEAPLGMQLLEALNRAGARKATQLRNVGDQSLFISGFFSDSLKRRLADVDYYVELGARAYLALAAEADSSLSPVFDELGRKFVGFVDVLAEISGRTALTSNNDLLRLYEKWLRTGSRREARLLAERGIVPNAAIGHRFLQ